MSDQEAASRAAARGLEAILHGGFCVLVRPGGAMVARGQTWDDAFARLEAPTREFLVTFGPGRPAAVRDLGPSDRPAQRGLFDA